MSKRVAGLSINEKYLLHYVRSIEKVGKKFFQNNEALAGTLEVTQTSVRRMIYKLIQEGYLIRSQTVSGQKYLSYTGKEYVPLAIFPSFPDLATKALKGKLDEMEQQSFVNNNIIENQKKEIDQLKKELVKLKSTNQELLAKIDKLETENADLEFSFNEYASSFA